MKKKVIPSQNDLLGDTYPSGVVRSKIFRGYAEVDILGETFYRNKVGQKLTENRRAKHSNFVMFWKKNREEAYRLNTVITHWRRPSENKNVYADAPMKMWSDERHFYKSDACFDKRAQEFLFGT